MTSFPPLPTLHPADTLELVSEVEPPAPPTGTGPGPKQPVAEGLLSALRPFLSEALVSQVGACYQFNVTLPSGSQSVYFLDLTTGDAPCPPTHRPVPSSWASHPCGREGGYRGNIAAQGRHHLQNWSLSSYLYCQQDNSVC